MPTGGRTASVKPVSGAKCIFSKTSAHRSKRPAGKCLCSLLLLLCWFDGAELFLLVFITILVRHVWVFNLGGCTRRLLNFRVISLLNGRQLCRPLLFLNVHHHSSWPMRCNPLTLTGPPPAFSLMVTGAFSSNSPRLTWRVEGMHPNHSGHFETGEWQETSVGTDTIGRQLTWRLAIGTEIVFPWWFMAVTSTTLLSSLAPSPRQIYKTPSIIYLRCL